MRYPCLKIMSVFHITLKQTSGEESINAEKRRTQAANGPRRYKERILSNRDVNSHSVENVNIPNSHNLTKFRGNDSNLSKHRNRSCLNKHQKSDRLLHKDEVLKLLRELECTESEFVLIAM